MPEIVPPVDMLRPAGRPVAEKVYGPPAPPLPVIVTGVMAMPCTALMITRQGAPMLKSTGIEQPVDIPVLPAESVAVIVGVKFPLAVGVPEMTPEEEIVRPGGRPV